MAYGCSPDNPLRNVNIVILACKYGQTEVLNFLFSYNCKIFQHWPRNAVLPTDTDEYQHNAFYYAIRSGKVKLAQTLIEKWPNDYPFQTSGKLNEILFNAYRELKLRNVELTIEMEVFVREMLFERDFYYTCETQESIGPFKIEVTKRIQFILNNIGILTSEFSESDVDERFLATAKFIAKNIHVLKIQLKSTYDKIPWEEIQFFLVIFILTVTESKENRLIHAHVLSKNKILTYLENFAKCLQDAQGIVNQSNETALRKPPTLKETGRIPRESCVLRITEINPLLKELYKDYNMLRDEYSLKTMKKYLDLALSVKCDEEGRLLITRALQVVGENLKNSVDSPKLSDTTCELLLLMLPDKTKEIVIALRDSVSHAEALNKRVEIEKGNEEFFNGIQDDLKKLNTAIVEVLCQCKIRVIRDELKEISECESAKKLEKKLKSLHFVNAGEELSEIPVLLQLERLEILIKDLSYKIKEKTPKEKSLFDQIYSEINLQKNRLDKIKTSMVTGLNSYNSFIVKSQKNKFENVKNEAKILLNKTFPEIEWSRLNGILVLLQQIFNYVKLKFDGKELEQMRYLQLKLLFYAEFEVGKTKLIEEYKCSIMENKRKVKRKKPRTSNEIELAVKLLSQKLTQLKNVLDNGIFRDFTTFQNNKKLHAVIEMLVLDIYSLLEERLSYNHFFLDDELVTLIGRNMRNHLAHENTLINILSAHSLIDLALNAKKISVECTQNTREIGKSFQCSINKVQFDHEQDLEIIALQKEMFTALADGNLEIVKNTLRKGADVKVTYMRGKTALHIASEGTSIETVKLVLDENCDINAKDANGQTALHIAARRGRSNIVDYLIKATKVFVDQLDIYHKTPLHIAAGHGHLEVVQNLINSKAITTVQDMYGNSPLHYALKYNHEDIAQALMDLEDDVEGNDAFGGLTPLHIASSNGLLRVVNYLIGKKVNVNAKTDVLNVPLHAAVQWRHLEIVRVLIGNGAEVNARCMDGTTALHLVCTIGEEAILELLLEHGAIVDDAINIVRRSPLSFAAQNGHQGIVKQLLKHKVKVNAKDVTGKTALHFAAQNGHKSVVEILLKNEASTDVTDHIRFTPMHYSASNGHTSVVRLLIEHGGSIHSRNTFQATPLNLAVLNGHLSVAKVLIDEKADVNNADISNSTALHTCCKKQFLEIAKLLVKNKADIHVPSHEFGITPFHLALGLGSKAMLEVFEVGGANVNDVRTSDFTALHLGTVNEDLEVMKYLIDLKCDVNAKSKSGLTALHLAVQQNNMSAIELLVENRSNLNIRDNKGHSPLFYAVQKNNKDIIEYLIAEKCIVEDEGNGEPLKSAVFNDFHDMVAILLKTGNFDANLKLANNDNVLMTSVLYRHKKVAEVLLENGAHIDAKSNNVTPLFIASLLGDSEMVKLLLSKGANPDCTSQLEEITPLYAAVTEGHTDVVDILLQAGARNVDYTNRSALQLAVQCSRVEVVKFLLEQKDVVVNEGIIGEYTLLHIAISKNELEIVKCLLLKGADVNARDTKGRNPFVFAADYGHKDIVEFLYKFSAKDAFIDNWALLLAVENGHLEVTKYLTENYIDVNSIITNDSETFLHIASKNNQKDIVLYFLNNGVYYNTENQSKKTPLDVTECPNVKRALMLVKKLFISIKRNDIVFLEEAVKRGAILNSKRKDNATLLHYAAWKGYGDILDVLLKNGANPNIVGRWKSTPLHYASKYGHLDIVRSLLSHGAIYNVQSHTGKIPLEYSTHQDVTELLSFVSKSFKSVQNGDSDFLDDMKALNNPETIKSVMKSRNIENKLLVTLAMRHDFPKIQQLKQVFNVDTNTMYAQAIAYRNCGRYSESLKLLKNILERRTEVLGYDNPDTLDVKDNIGEVLLMQHDLENALKIFDENFKTQKEALGDNDISTLRTNRYLAITLDKLGEKTKALKLLQEVCNRQTISFGKSHSQVLETQILISTILELDDNDEEALEQFSTVYEVYKESKRENHPECLKVQAEIAMLLSKRKRYDEAIEKLKRLYETQKRTTGTGHPNTLEILSKIAHVYHLKGSFNEALKIYKSILDFEKTEFRSDHLSLLRTRHKIGHVYFSQQKMLGAFEIFVKCYNRCLELMGPYHILTQNVHNSLELVKSNFTLEYGDVGCCVLEQMEKDIRLKTAGGQRSFEESIKETSDIYLQHIKRNICDPLTRFIPNNLENVTSDHFIEFLREMSRFRSMSKGDDCEGTETWTKFVDKDVFYYMFTHKGMNSGIHVKFDDVGRTKF